MFFLKKEVFFGNWAVCGSSFFSLFVAYCCLFFVSWVGFFLFVSFRLSPAPSWSLGRARSLHQTFGGFASLALSLGHQGGGNFGFTIFFSCLIKHLIEFLKGFTIITYTYQQNPSYHLFFCFFGSTFPTLWPLERP